MDTWNEVKLCQHIMDTAVIVCVADRVKKNPFISWHLFRHGGEKLVKTLANTAHKVTSK